MHPVIKKAWADLRGRYWQSALIALSVGAAAALLYLGLASMFAASSPYEKQMVRAHGAHAWFYLKDDATGRAAAAHIAARSEVTESIQRPVVTSYLVAPETNKIPWVDVMPMEPGQPRLMGYILMDGRDLLPLDQGAALLSVSMAHYLHVSPGDSVRVQTKDGPRAVQVVGLIAEPKSCTFPRCREHSLYVSPETFASLSPADGDQATLVGVRLKDPQAADLFVSQVRTLEAGSVRGTDSWLDLQDFYKGDRLFNVIPILLFGIVAVIAAAMILVNIIGGAVLGQYREIAVLKALGMTGVQVLLLYVGQTLLLGLMGGALGVLGGHLLAIHTMAPLARNMGTPDVLHFMPTVAGAVFVTVLSVASLFAALAAWRAVTLRPAAMLAEGFAAPRARMGLPVRLMSALRLPALVVLGVKDALARPARAVMTVLSLTVCLIAITMSLNFPGMANQIMVHREFIGINWDMTVEPKLLSLNEAEAAVRALPGLQGYYREKSQVATVVDQNFDLGVRAVDGDWDHFGFQLMLGHLPQQPGEILLAPRAWERLGVKDGDQLRLQIDGKILPVTVVGKYQDQINSGRMALMTLATLQQVVPDAAQHAALRVKLQTGTVWMAARQSLLAATNYRPLVFLEDSELPDFARDGVAMMSRLAWVMVTIAGLSIMGATLLTAKEQMREVGIRKVIGMTPAQVIGSVAAGGAWYGLVAIALALPSSYLLQKGLTAAMASVMGLGQVPLALPGNILLISSAVGMTLAVVAVLPAAAWGAQLVTAQVLQAE